MRAVLMLHSVDDSGSVLSVTPEQLRSLVQAIRASGHRVVPLSRLLESSAEDLIALTFDDGFRSVSEQAAPVLEQLAAPATLFLTTERVGRDNLWPGQPADAPRFEIMDWAAVKRLASAGWAIEAHSLNHPDLRELDEAELERELSLPAQHIERETGRRPRVLAYPYGYFDARVVERARRHFDFAVTTVFRPLGAREDALRLPRLDAYYLRSPLVHRHFGSPAFLAYLAARGALRRWRGHPGEIA
jgi:peptidoglycan/xylan/chitin deacetylase (PgdA/CDA1 family)